MRSYKCVSVRSEAILLSLALLLGSSCQGPHGVDKAPHVVFIGIDGAGSHNLWPTDPSIKTPNIPHINALLAKSSFSKAAAIDKRNWSGPNWTGMLTGKDSDTHGVTSNECIKSSIPTVFDTIDAKYPDYDIGMVANWSMLKCYSKEQSLDFANMTDAKDQDVAARALDVIKERKPNFLFVYFGDVDSVGHEYGAWSEEFKNTIEEVDSHIGKLVQAINKSGQEVDIILSADHGHALAQKGHSDSEHPVPLVVQSNRIKPGKIDKAVANRMTAPLILWLFGLSDAQPL